MEKILTILFALFCIAVLLVLISHLWSGFFILAISPMSEIVFEKVKNFLSSVESEK